MVTKAGRLSERDKQIQDISYILKDLLKVVKVVYMYPEDNPLPQSLKRSFSEKLVSLVDQYGDLKVKVKQDSLLFENETVYVDKSKEEALAGIFFETGITGFAFGNGLDVPDVYKLLDVFKAYLNSPSRSFDIVAGFWEAQIVGFSFTTVEDIALAEYDNNFDYQDYLSRGDGDENSGTRAGVSSEGDYQRIFQGQIDLDSMDKVDGALKNYKGKIDKSRPATREELLFYAQSFGQTDDEYGNGEEEISLLASEAAEQLGFTEQSAVGPSRPSTTMILNDALVLSEEEEKKIQQLVTEDALFEPYESTVELLKEMLLQEDDLPGFSETVTICEKICSEFVHQGKLMEAAQILTHLNQIQEETGQQHPVWVERLKEALISAGSREKLSQLRDTLNSHPDIGSGMLRNYLANFGWEALSGITELLGTIRNEQHHSTVCDYLASYGKENLHIVSRGISDKNPEVVASSVEILGRLDDTRVYPYLEKLVTHESLIVRGRLIETLATNHSEKSTEIIGSLARDNDPGIRRKAIRTLSEVPGPYCFNIIADLINDDSFAQADQDEQRLLLNSLSRRGGEHAVGYLRSLILKYNFFRGRTLAFLRMAAFEAISLNKSEKAEKTLVRLAGNWRPGIRRMARDAMNQRRAMIYEVEE